MAQKDLFRNKPRLAGLMNSFALIKSLAGHWVKQIFWALISASQALRHFDARSSFFSAVLGF